MGECYGDEQKYLKLAQRYNVDDVIDFRFGFVQNEIVNYYFCASDFVVLPYKSASQSGIIPLAYKYLRPIVTTDLPGLSNQILEDKTGIICKINSDSIANGIKKALESKNYVKMKNQISLKIKSYTWESFSLKAMNFIKNIKT